MINHQGDKHICRIGNQNPKYFWSSRFQEQQTLHRKHQWNPERFLSDHSQRCCRCIHAARLLWWSSFLCWVAGQYWNDVFSFLWYIWCWLICRFFPLDPGLSYNKLFPIKNCFELFGVWNETDFLTNHFQLY